MSPMELRQSELDALEVGKRPSAMLTILHRIQCKHVLVYTVVLKVEVCRLRIVVNPKIGRFHSDGQQYARGYS